jgi:hypothetical protein
MGKTSLLHRLEAEIVEQGGIALFFSMSHLRKTDDRRQGDDGKQFFSKFLISNEEIIENCAVKPYETDMDEFEKREFGELEAADRFHKLYAMVRRGKKDVAFLWDEAERLCDVETVDPGFLGRLFELFQDTPRFRFVVAATQLLSELYKRTNGADQFLYQFRWIPLPGLLDVEAGVLTQCQGHAAWQPPLPGEYIDEVVRWSGGHPLILQVLGAKLEGSALGGRPVSVETARELVRSVVKTPQLDLRGIFLDDYKKLTLEQQAVLRAACNHPDGGPVAAADVARNEQRDPPAVDEAVVFLASYGYVTVDATGLFHLRFRFYRDFLPDHGTGTDAVTANIGLIPRRSQPVLWITQKTEEQGQPVLQHTLTAGTKGIGGITGKTGLKVGELEGIVAGLIERPRDLRDLKALGERLASALFSDDLSRELAALLRLHIVVYHDTWCSQVPWELIRVGNRTLCAGAGVSRRHLASPGVGARWLEPRSGGQQLTVLLVADPTENLADAFAEGRMIERLFSSDPMVEVTPLFRENASKARLLEEIRSGKFDAVHYAGHALYNPDVPEKGGLVCYKEEVLTGSDLVDIARPPALVVFNACQAGRIRSSRRPTGSLRDLVPVRDRIGIAEAFLVAGIANYVGTYWPVGDRDARMFARTFYRMLSTGRTIGQSLARARRTLRRKGSVDWLNYLHYGDYDFALKRIPNKKKPGTAHSQG